ncbi:MAG: hypothetical protein F6K23_05675 [Okeania sp. SIO2C9]|uniref:hypothetical protein n=1 Tax=Okeania sp. SIO2C9 TaxID=2607791 RepID=UPI0013C1FE04|nr:hypothetical protein [Okeania sp. SIO2C9]NEQ72603.1 hypothetical protein [Okeania sp. SIO2C9]
MNKWERNDGCGFGLIPFWILDLGNFLCAGVLGFPDVATLRCWYKKKLKVVLVMMIRTSNLHA